MLAFIGGIIGVVVGFLGSWLALKFNYKQLFADTVSKNRMDWINNFREELSIVLGTYRVLPHKKSKSEKGKPYEDQNEETALNNTATTIEPADILKAERARVKLLTRLNQDTAKASNEYNAIFAERLNSIDFNLGYNEVLYDELVDYSRKILEVEWRRVKKEAQGER